MEKGITQEIKFKEKKEFKFKERISWLFVGPGVIIQLIFGWFPIAVAFVVAFQKFYVVKPSVYVGWENFKFFLPSNNPITSIVFKNTFYFTALSLGLTFLVPIFVAILLMEMRKSVIRVMMILWFIPVASMAGIIIWKYFYNVQYGLFNGILATLGFPTIGWLNDPRITMLCLVLPGLIMFAPGLIYIATLQGIPDSLYEAAELEGTKFFQKIWYITLPRLRPIMAMMLILAVIGRLQVFNLPYVMTGGGPAMVTYTVVMYIFDNAFKSMKFGKGSALAVILFFIIMALVILQRKFFKENIDV